MQVSAPKGGLTPILWRFFRQKFLVRLESTKARGIGNFGEWKCIFSGMRYLQECRIYPEVVHITTDHHEKLDGNVCPRSLKSEYVHFYRESACNRGCIRCYDLSEELQECPPDA